RRGLLPRRGLTCPALTLREPRAPLNPPRETQVRMHRRTQRDPVPLGIGWPNPALSENKHGPTAAGTRTHGQGRVRPPSTSRLAPQVGARVRPLEPLGRPAARGRSSTRTRSAARPALLLHLV